MILLDTDVLSGLRKRDRSPALISWLGAQPETALFISVVTIGEIERGIHLQRPRNPDFADTLAVWLDRLLAVYGDRVLPFDLTAGRLWGALSAQLGHDGADLQIAATALAHGLTVATGNVRHFQRAGVPVVNPFETVVPPTPSPTE